MDNSPDVPAKKIPTKIIIVILVTAIVLLVGAIGVLIFGKQEVKTSDQNLNIEAGQISGTLNINGIIPPGATLTLAQKTIGSNIEPVAFVSGLTPHDGDSWNFNDAKPGESYEILAKLMMGNQEVASSSPISVSAPSTTVELVLNVASEDNSFETAVISGNIIVNGYIPNGSTISIKGRSLGEETFESIAQNLPGQPRQFMTYTTARGGVTYEIVGTLYGSNGSSIIGTSPTLTVTAPAVNETLIINSTAQPPATPTPIPTSTPNPLSSGIRVTITPTRVPTPTVAPAVISGSISFNGVAPPNSRIVILQKLYNAPSYKVAVDNITPINGATWQWGNPVGSTWYDIIAVLKQRQSDGSDLDITTATMQSVAAPATSVQFTLNSGFSLSAPGGSISVDCGNLSGTTWYAEINFDSVSGAKSYWYQIGTSSGGIQVANSSQNASGTSNLVVSVQLANATTYYARYAYGNIANLSAGSSQFSPFSSVQPLQCGS